MVGGGGWEVRWARGEHNRMGIMGKGEETLRVHKGNVNRKERKR